jgi:hypothetical protein
MRRAAIIVAALALALAACSASSSLPAVRFANAPPVQAVNDRHHVAKAPAERKVVLSLYHYDGTFHKRITRGLALPRQRRALGVNAIDEVPDSTWFTGRIGVRALTPDEVRRGPTVAGSPEPHRPWTIVSTKIGGRDPGFLIRDARGEKYLLKFDQAGFPEMETSADVIVSRILWAIGYHVPEDHIVYFAPADLVLDPEAVVKDVFDREKPLDRAELDRTLGLLDEGPDGKIRGLVSRLLEGEVLGGHPAVGVRDDDPNDRISHQLRRDLRGAYAIFAWLDHSDIKEDNSLDMWIADPADPARKYVRHYWVDFGLSLGVQAAQALDRRRSHEYKIDFTNIGLQLVTLGLRQRRWEGRSSPPLRGIGLYEAETFDPGRWHPMTPSYVPFLTADRIDGAWAARLIMRFSREQLTAIVDAARFSDPRAAAYMVETLVRRQRATGRYWFARVSALEGFAIEAQGAGHALCFDDAMLTYQLAADPAATRYRITSHDRDGRALGAATTSSAAAGGHSCVGPLALAGGDGYTIVRIETTRPEAAGSVLVHLAPAPGGGGPRVIGVWRE